MKRKDEFKNNNYFISLWNNNERNNGIYIMFYDYCT